MRALLSVLAVLMSHSGAQAQGAGAAVASIAVEASQAGVTLRGQALALSAGRFETSMRIEKSGPSGRTSTTQGGALSLAAGEAGTVATVGLSLAPGDTLSIELVVTAGGQVVSTSQLSVGQ